MQRKWAENKLNQKRHILVNFLKARTTAFWKVCGKNVQHHYLHLDFTETNVDSVKDEIVSVYKQYLENAIVFNKDVKLNYLERHLA